MVEGRIEARYREILGRIENARARAKGPPVTLVAVSKYQPVEAVVALYRFGHRDFGENYVQDLVKKAEELESRGCPGIRWHFIGHLQTNKAKLLLERASVVQSVDSAKTGGVLAKRWAESGHAEPLPVFLQVNIDREPSKSGMDPSMVPAVARELASVNGIRLEGLMTIPAQGTGSSKEAFARMRELSNGLGPLTQGKLSMGMSQDFEVAVEHGATHVRVGTLLFGERGQ
ncbi:MAG: YggS family pyridoxal phosphate-dependent enzyme [Bdellovibrionales bacterium]|nr:YggS family pyridoxal phosphate-dependent enzyme [Bdellovibrionales bacterium]